MEIVAQTELTLKPNWSCSILNTTSESIGLCRCIFLSCVYLWTILLLAAAHIVSVCLGSSGCIVFLLFALGPLKSQTSSKIFHPVTHKHCVKDEWRGQSCIPALMDSESKRGRETQSFRGILVSSVTPAVTAALKVPPDPKTSQTSRSADSSPFHKVNDKYVEKKSYKEER